MMGREWAERQAALLPAELRDVLTRARAAGNRLVDMEFGRGPTAGRVLILMDHPFRFAPGPLPAGVLYRERADGDRVLCEYHTPDQEWALATARPAAEAPAAAAAPPPPATAADRFRASLVMDFDKWHDGTGYDLAALALVPPAELPAIEAMLLARRPLDWRDVEALARLDTPAARAAVAAAANDPDPPVRREATSHLPPAAVDPAARAARLVADLASADLAGGLSAAIDDAADFHPPAVVDALFRGALRRPGPAAVHFAALLYYLHGKAAEPFDWAHRPLFLRFDGTAGRDAHVTAFDELCAAVGVDAARYGTGPA